MMRLLPVAGASLALVVAGCGSSKKSSSTSSSPPAAATTSAATTSAPTSGGPTSLALRPSKLGPYLVDGTGRTVYLFLADKGGKSACYGKCAKVWAPLVDSGVTAPGPGVSLAKMSVLNRRDGVAQVVYNGHPLYHYDDDHQAGQMKGQGKKEFGAEWYVLSAAGLKLEKKGA